MESTTIIFQQILLMMMYMAGGFVLFRSRQMTSEGAAGLASALIHLILPCAILKSFLVERTPETTRTLVYSLGCGIGALLFSILIAEMVFRDKPLDCFSAAFSNAGFMGLPLVGAVLGPEATFCVGGMIAFLNILQWYYGQKLLSGGTQRQSLKTVLKNPLVLSFAAGLAVFFLDIPLPGLVQQSVASIAGMNAPVAMMVLGVYLAQTNIKTLFGTLQTYWVSFVRLILIPVMLLLVLMPLSFIHMDIRMAVFLAASAPVGANVAVYAQRLGKDYVYAVEMVCLSTLLSVVSLPLMVAMAQKVFR